MGFFDRFFAHSLNSGTCGESLRWELDGNTLTIGGTGKMKDYSGTQSPPWYCRLRKAIKRIVINVGVTTIGDTAFWDCYNLTEIKIPNSVKKIGRGSFESCWKLKKINIPNSVTVIGEYAFNICLDLSEIFIPDSITKIGEYAFNGCDGLTNITIPDRVTTIGEGAFQRCQSLMNVTISDSVTNIDRNVFNECKNLKEIHYPAGRGFEKNLSDGNKAKLIPYTVTQPTTQTGKKLKFYPAQTTKPVTEKLTWSFEGKTLTVGGVREIKNFPYAQIPWIDHLHDIQRIIIGNGVEKISAHAFDECPRLEILELPASVKTIGDMAFSVCFCGSITGRKNVFWSLEDGVLVLKKNPDAPPVADFSTGSVSWIFAEKNIRSVKLEDGVKPTEKFFSWLTQRFNGKEISLK